METGSQADTTPKATVARLSLYLRELETLHRAGQETVSSNQLGRALEITDAQVRKDLAYFGQFGCPGIGYRVGELRDSLKGLLGTNRTWHLAMIGVGNIGRALLGYRGFQERGFTITALFDRDASVVGKSFRGLQVQDMEKFSEIVRVQKIRLAILAVPVLAAQEVADTICAVGIEGILNFAPIQLKVPKDVAVTSVDLGLQLEQLAFSVNKRSTNENGRHS